MADPGWPDVDEPADVSGVGEGTRRLARRAAELDPETALDVGTGTGFIAVHLAARGASCTATDINPAAVRCARRNAVRNGVEIETVRSDLFDTVTGTYDVITFHPPMGRLPHPRLMRLLERVKSLFPRDDSIVDPVAFRLLGRGRRRLIRRFLTGMDDHLAADGDVLVTLHPRELSLLPDRPRSVLDSYHDRRLVRIPAV